MKVIKRTKICDEEVVLKFKPENGRKKWCVWWNLKNSITQWIYTYTLAEAIEWYNEMVDRMAGDEE